MSHLQLHPPSPFVLISRPAAPHFPSQSTASYFQLYIILNLLSRLATPHFPSQSTMSHPQLHPSPFMLISRPVAPHFPSQSTMSHLPLYVPTPIKLFFSFLYFFFLSHFIFALSVVMPISNITFSHLQMIFQEQIFTSYSHQTYYIKLSKAPLKIILSLG